jgi:HTH-type transcriptional regulator/antitoxin HipB
MKEESISTRSAEQLGAALHRLRNQKGHSQAYLGKKAGLRQGTISKAESGAKNTEIATIYAICAALGLELVVKPRTQGKAGELLDLFSQ